MLALGLVLITINFKDFCSKSQNHRNCGIQLPVVIIITQNLEKVTMIDVISSFN